MRSLAISFALLLALTSTSFAQNGVWVNYTTANSGLYSDTVSSIVVGNDKTLWLGTWFGLDKFDGTTWTSYYQDLEHVPSKDIFDLNYSFDALWIAHREGLTKFNGTTWQTFTEENSGLVNAPVLNLTNDQERVYAGTARGLSRIDDEGVWTSFTSANTPAFPYSGIAALTSDPSDNVWIAFINTRGLVKFPNGNSVMAKRYRVDTIPNFPQAYLTALAVDHSGNLWAATEHNGAVKINGSGATQYSTQTTSAFKNNNTNKIAVDHCGKVWVATEGGAVMYDGNSWLSVTKSGGNLLNDWVYTVYVDPDGHVWFGTQGGVSEFKPLPEKPTLMGPANWAVVTTDSVTCRWNWTCPNIQKYWHELADNDQFSNALIDTTSASLTQSASKWDTVLKDQTTYYWRVRAKNDAGWGPYSDTWSFTVNKTSGVESGSAYAFAVEPVRPNPIVGASSELIYTIPTRSNVSIKLFDVLGHEVATLVTGVVDEGRHTCTIAPEVVTSSGVYICRIDAGLHTASARLQILREAR